MAAVSALHAARPPAPRPKTALTGSRRRLSVRRSQAQPTEVEAAESVVSESIVLPAQDAARDVRFAVIGKYVAVSAVREGSVADQSGVEPGRQLFAVSDPNAGDGRLWEVSEGASARFVSDLVRLSRDDVTLVLGPPIAQDELARLEAEARLVRERETDISRRRQERRDEYLEEVGRRNDVPFLGWLAAAFIVPPALILWYAAQAGLLFRTYSG